MQDVLDDIFRAYDVRGTGEDLTPAVMETIGQAFGTYVIKNGHEEVVVGHDARRTSEDLYEALIDGIRKSPVSRIDKVGNEPFGVVQFHGWQTDKEIAYITASHLPPAWNGVKFYHQTGVGYAEEENMTIKDQIIDDTRRDGEDTTIEAVDAREPYINYLDDAIDSIDLDILLDCGNGMSGVTAPLLFEKQGATVTTLFEEPDGSFPNRESDVSADSLTKLADAVGDHDLGIAFDGDADRCAVMLPDGTLLDADELAALVLDTFLEQQQGPVIANVECSSLLDWVTERHGVPIERVRVGHTYLLEAAVEHDAVFGVEKSGHFTVPHIFPLDDGVATALFMASVIDSMEGSLTEQNEQLPDTYRDRIAFECSSEIKFDVVEHVGERVLGMGDITAIDGVRLERDEGWVLIRASNTSPKVRLTVEAETEEGFETLKKTFSQMIEQEIRAS